MSEVILCKIKCKVLAGLVEFPDGEGGGEFKQKEPFMTYGYFLENLLKTFCVDEDNASVNPNCIQG